MKICPNCHNPADDNVTFCPNCGTKIAENAVPQPQTPPQQMPYMQQPMQRPVIPDPFDHTSEYTADDVAASKLYAMLVYVLGAVGIVIALLAGKDSPYAKFHARQGMKIVLLETICTLATVVLFWTFIAPLAGGIAVVILFVLRVICFIQVCQGKAVEPYLIRSLTFLK